MYEVTGEDEEGVFETKRRYNDFYVLYEQLTKRWPGIIIPQIPGKSAINSILEKVAGEDAAFLKERSCYLERFLRKLSKHDFIINGEAFRIFSRDPIGQDICSALKKLPILSTQMVYERISDSTKIIITDYDEGQISRYEIAIAEMQNYVKAVDPLLKTVKNELIFALTVKEQTIR